MGTPFHLGIMDTGFELNIMKAIGVDATTLGNHEFDFRPKGLAKIVLSAIKNGEIPVLTNSNIKFSQKSDADDTLEELFKDGTIKNYSILEKQGIRIGIYGIIGKDAIKVPPNSKPIEYQDPKK